jgi:hypothetical protein
VCLCFSSWGGALIVWWAGRIRDESSVQELKIREVDTRIESEISGLRTALEQSKVCSVTALFIVPSTMIVLAL